MNRLSSLTQRFVLGLVVSLAAAASACAQVSEGTWRLVKRQLPDGTVLTAPAVVGMGTVSKGIRHINVFWHLPDGKAASFGIISKTRHTPNEYSETVLASVYDDGSGKPVAYNFSGDTKSTAVTRTGNRVSYQLPFDPPVVTYDGDKMVATFEGVFTDFWERMK